MNLIRPCSSRFISSSKLISYTIFRGLSSNSSDSDVFSNNEANRGDLGAFDLTPNIPEAEEAQERDEKFRQYVERSRDVSRFSKITALLKHRQQVPTFGDPEAKYLKDARYFRRVLARNGLESGVEPGVAWPSRKELNAIVQEEKEFDLTLEQKIDVLIKRKKEEIEKIEKMEKESDEALKKMPKLVDSYFQRLVKKEQAEAEKKAKKQVILDQAREYYGFEVDLRDPRIQDMVNKLQEKKKVEEKQKKKEEDKKKTQMNALKQKTKGAAENAGAKAEAEQSEDGKEKKVKEEKKTANKQAKKQAEKSDNAKPMENSLNPK